MMTTQIFPDRLLLAQAAADAVIADLIKAIKKHGDATWVIAGGSVPVMAYKVLANRASDVVQVLDWSKVHVVIGDERCVPFDSPDSNWKQAFDALLQHLPLATSVVRPSTNLSPEAAAEQYDAYIGKLPKNLAGLPRLDHVWLGMGEDGHTLSLFPNHTSTSVEASERFVIAVHDSPKPPADRISLTFHALQGAGSCLILIAGAAKASAAFEALAGNSALPIAQASRVIEQAGGSVTWLLDEAAAQQSNVS